MMSDGLLRYMRDGFSGMLKWPLFAWLRPVVPVRLIRAQGLATVVLGCSLDTAPPGTVAKAAACLLPEESVLVHEILLPDLGSEEIGAVVAGEVRSNSPFPPESVLSGWLATAMPDDRLKVRIAMADQGRVATHMKSAEVDHDAEAWVEVAGGVIALDGVGGRVRRRSERTILTVRLLLICLLILQGAALFVVPLWVERDRAIQAIAQLDTLSKASAPAVGARDALNRVNQGLEAMAAVAKDKLDVPGLIETLTHVMPDDASVTRIEVNGRHVKIMGTAANGTGLLDLLSARDEFKEVKATSPISRMGGAKRDSYVIEFDAVLQGGES